MNYQLFIEWEVVEAITRLSKREQRQLRDRLVAIRGHPAAFVDCAQFDKTGRPVDVNIFGPFAIVYWVDHADRQVKIIALADADRA